MEHVLRDLRTAARGLKRSWGFALTVASLIALGIGINGTAFSLFQSIMHGPLAGVTAENLVSLGAAIDGREAGPGNSRHNDLDHVESSKPLRRITARGFGRFVSTLDAASHAIRGGLTTHDYFDTLARISHRLRAEARDRPAITSLRLLAVLTVVSSTRLWSS